MTVGDHHEPDVHDLAVKSVDALAAGDVHAFFETAGRLIVCDPSQVFTSLGDIVAERAAAWDGAPLPGTDALGEPGLEALVQLVVANDAEGILTRFDGDPGRAAAGLIAAGAALALPPSGRQAATEDV